MIHHSARNSTEFFILINVNSSKSHYYLNNFIVTCIFHYIHELVQSESVRDRLTIIVVHRPNPYSLIFPFPEMESEFAKMGP